MDDDRTIIGGYYERSETSLKEYQPLRCEWYSTPV